MNELSRCGTTVVVTTKNRRDDLRAALRSAIWQTVGPEVLVIDDGSDDGTSDMVRREFPEVRLIRHESSKGLVVRRNEGARLAQGGVIVSIDDDAYFDAPDVLEVVLRDFDHPRVGAVAIPFSEPKKSLSVQQASPDADDIWVADRFIGTAHAVRRDLFLSLGGYREHIIHQGEERDFSLRMLAAGFVVRLGRAGRIVHLESPRRDFRRMDYFGQRNLVRFALENVPLSMLPAHLAATTFHSLRLAWRTKRWRDMTRGLLTGYLEMSQALRVRRAVPLRLYWLHRRLVRRGPIRLREVEVTLASLNLTLGGASSS